MAAVHLIMPMAGLGSRFEEGGFRVPKPLIEIHGHPLFYWATQSIVKFIEPRSLRYVVLQEHVDSFGIDSRIMQYYPEARVTIIPEVLMGPVLTCLVGVNDLGDDEMIAINDCDHMFESRSLNSLFTYEARDRLDLLDGAVLTFKSVARQYSYVLLDREGYITGAHEKNRVSNDAICGLYFFKHVGLFREMSEGYLATRRHAEAYISGVVDFLAQKSGRMGTFAADFHVSFGTPEEYANALDSKHFGRLA